MAVAAGDSSEAEAKHQHNQLKIAIIHSDLGIGGYDKRLKEVEYVEELRRLARTEGVPDQVTFATLCSMFERNKLLCLNTPKVFYIMQDGHFGIVPLEAMAAQKPVIACNSACRDSYK